MPSKQRYSKNKIKSPPLLLLLLVPITRLPPIYTIAILSSTSDYPVSNAATDWDGVSSVARSQDSTKGSCAKPKSEFSHLFSLPHCTEADFETATLSYSRNRIFSDRQKGTTLILSNQRSTSLSHASKLLSRATPHSYPAQPHPISPHSRSIISKSL